MYRNVKFISSSSFAIILDPLVFFLVVRKICRYMIPIEADILLNYDILLLMYVKSVRNLYLSTYLHKRQNFHICVVVPLAFYSNILRVLCVSVNDFENR